MAGRGKWNERSNACRVFVRLSYALQTEKPMGGAGLVKAAGCRDVPSPRPSIFGNTRR